MTIHNYSWETSLLDKAQRAITSHTQRGLRTVEDALAHNPDHCYLERAYQVCEQITQQNSRTFYLASRLLPAPKRRAVRALYAFCRTSDDLVDRASASDPRQALDAWRHRTMSHTYVGESQDALVAAAWSDTRRRFSIPFLYAEQLIDGVSADLGTVRYETFDQLADYCYGVASTVGLMSMHITGFCGPEAIPYAIRLGVALQLTNILRDVAEDWRNGRLYLPLTELRNFGLSEGDIATGRVDSRWRAFMRFQIERARKLYAEALPGIRMLDRDGRFAIAAAARLYEAILSDIESHDYDNFSRRAHLSAWGKLSRLPGVWLQAMG